MNTGTYSVERLLRHIEYGIAPSFVVTGCDSVDLYKTAQEDYITTNYNDWKGSIREAHTMITDALRLVKGQTIMEHLALEDGLIRVTYENGVRIYVNYTEEAKMDNNITVEPGWYKVVK